MTMQRMEPQSKGDIRLKTSEGAAYEQQCLGGLRPPRHCCSYAAPSSVLSRISPCFLAPFAHCSNGDEQMTELGAFLISHYT